MVFRPYEATPRKTSYFLTLRQNDGSASGTTGASFSYLLSEYRILPAVS